MKTIDKEVLAWYDLGLERNRLRKDLGLIEFERTKELLRERLPKPPAVVYDVGGAYGEYAWWLTSLGCEVHLFDLSETNIAMSAELAAEYPGCALAAAEVADARAINRPDESADAILLFGPLYHIAEKGERIAALKECRRLLKPGGLLFTAAITPYSVMLHMITVFGVKNRLLEEETFMRMVEHELATGEHIKPENSGYKGIGRSHFHTPSALRSELAEAGFASNSVHAAVGAAWLAPNLDELWKDPAAREALLRTVRLMDGREDILSLSTHLVGISRKPGKVCVSGMTIRSMSPEDWPCMEKIYERSLHQGTVSFASNCPDYEKWDADHHKECRLVCEAEGKIAGFAALSPTSSKPHYKGVAEVSIYIDEDHRRKGIGTALLIRLCEEADAHGYWTLYSSIFEENAPSIELHKKCGFRIIGRREKIAKNIFGRWQSTILMERRNNLE